MKLRKEEHQKEINFLIDEVSRCYKNFLACTKNLQGTCNVINPSQSCDLSLLIECVEDIKEEVEEGIIVKDVPSLVVEENHDLELMHHKDANT